MIDRLLIQKIVLNAIAEMNESFDEDERISCTEETILFGVDGELNSLNLVSLIVLTEEKIEDELGYSLVLGNEKAMSQKSSPFKSVKALTDFIVILLDEVGE